MLSSESLLSKISGADTAENESNFATRPAQVRSTQVPSCAASCLAFGSRRADERPRPAAAGAAAGGRRRGAAGRSARDEGQGRCEVGGAFSYR